MTKSKHLQGSQAATFEDLEARRIEKERELASLRAAHSQSIIDGNPFDASPIRDAEDELRAIETAALTIAEMNAQREREEADRLARLSDEERRQRIAEGINALLHDWLSEVAEMERHARQMAAALGRANKQREALHAALLTQGQSPFTVMPREFETRIGQGLSALLFKTTGKTRIGSIVLNRGMRDADLPWVDAEASARKSVADAIDEVLEPEQNA